MRNVDDLFPLTPVQNLMLLHERGGAGENTLANQVCYDLRGPLDESALREALRRLVERHPALRTGVLDDAALERPLQVVRSRVEVPLEVVDLSGTAPDLQAEARERVRSADSARRFDLRRPPLMRCTLIRLAPDAHQFIWTLHHLVTDRWGFSVAYGELAALYGECAGGPVADLPDAVAFRHYVAWLKERDAVADDAFWREELASVTVPTSLASSAGGAPRRIARRRIGPGAAEGIDAAARARRVSPATMVLGAVALEVGRRAATAEPLVGLTVSGRPSEIPGVERIVGSFVNSVPAPVDLDGSVAVADWLGSLQRRSARRRSHEHLGLDRILDVAGLDGGPWFDLLLVLNLDPPPAPDWLGLRVSVASATLDAGFPLVLQAARKDGALELALVHGDGCIDADELLDGVVGVLEALAHAPASAPLASVAPIPDEATGAPRARPVPASGIEQRQADRTGSVRAVWREILGVERAQDEDDFFALGGTSLQAARLLARLEVLAGRPVPMAALLTGRTLGSLLDAVVPVGPATPTGPLLALREGGHRPPFIGVPGLRGNLILFVPLVEHLSPGRPIYGLQSRGTDREETLLTTMDAIAADYVEQLGELVEGPYHLFGLCWGAAAAFAMTAQLVARGTPPRSLSLLDPAVLLGRDPRPRVSQGGGTLDFARQRIGLYWDEFRSRGWRERGRFLAEKAGRLAEIVSSGGAEALPKSELRERAVIEANLGALEQYDPPVVDVEARLFLSQDFDLGGRPDPRREWVAQFRRAPSIASVPGFDSGDAVKEHTDAVASALDAWLEARDGGSR